VYSFSVHLAHLWMQVVKAETGSAESFAGCGGGTKIQCLCLCPSNGVHPPSLPPSLLPFLSIKFIFSDKYSHIHL
jgi:hypothetical protein